MRASLYNSWHDAIETAHNTLVSTRLVAPEHCTPPPPRYTFKLPDSDVIVTAIREPHVQSVGMTVLLTGPQFSASTRNPPCLVVPFDSPGNELMDGVTHPATICDMVYRSSPIPDSLGLHALSFACSAPLIDYRGTQQSQRMMC